MTELPPSVRPPTETEIREHGEYFGLELSDAEVEDFAALLDGRMAVPERIEELAESRGRTERPNRASFGRRDPGYRPGPDEDPHNAVVTRCLVEGADDGPLSGLTVGVKDNVAVAGVEMTCATPVMEGYVPRDDAFVVEQLLDAGATVTAKTNMDEMAVSGSGELTPTGPITNPVDDDYLAGGSSGGSVVAVVTGEVDVAIGTDQAGSLRTPAAWSGCVGFKPTHGLVSYSGIAPIGYTFDHVGPIADSAADCALVLDAITGEDPNDPRQVPASARPGIDHESDSYAVAVEASTDVGDLSVGVLDEGFGSAFSDPGVDEAVRDAADVFGDIGASVEDVSVPWHEDGLIVWLAVETEAAAMLWETEGTGYFRKGRYDTDLASAFAARRRSRGAEFAPTVKLKLVFGRYLRERFHGRFHRKAQNLRADLTAAYDEALEDVDVLAMPTTPMTAFEHVPDLSRRELVRRAAGKTGRTRNTMPFDMTGHPAISVPCGLVDGLPAGLMLVGDRFDETTVLRAAAAFEGATDWASRTYTGTTAGPA